VRGFRFLFASTEKALVHYTIFLGYMAYLCSVGMQKRDHYRIFLGYMAYVYSVGMQKRDRVEKIRKGKATTKH